MNRPAHIVGGVLIGFAVGLITTFPKSLIAAVLLGIGVNLIVIAYHEQRERVKQ